MSEVYADSILENAYAIYSADLEAAKGIFQEVLDAAVEHKWKSREAKARRVLGVTLYLQGDYDAALELYQQSLQISEELGDDQGRASALNELGNFFSKRKEFARAEELLRQGAAIAIQAGDSLNYSNSLDMLGMVMNRQGKLGEAEALWMEVLGIRRQISDSVGMSYVYANLGDVAGQRRQSDRALAYLDSSIQLRTALGDRQGIAVAVNNQGETLLALGDTLGAIPYLEESLKLSTAVSYPDLMQWTMGLLASSYASQGRFADALRMQQRVLVLKDSLYNAETTARVAEMQERFDAEGRERTIELERARLRQRTAYLVAAIALVALLGAWIAWLVARQRRRRKEMLESARQRLRDDRLRISRDLHDHLGAELSIVASDIGRLQSTEASEQIKSIRQQVHNAIDQMRETIWAVRTEGGTWADVFAQLRSFAGRLEHPGIVFSLDESLAQELLDPYRMLNLYRFGQEAIRNAVRHAEATHIRVHCDRRGFSVEDDGKGISAEVQQGFGLASLEERARELNAGFRIESPGTGGTVLRLIFDPAMTSVGADVQAKDPADLL